MREDGALTVAWSDAETAEPLPFFDIALAEREGHTCD